MSAGPTLVLLAAGIGRRFGGLKQLAPIGPKGEAILDLTIADAAAAGFDDVALIVRRSILDEMRAHVEARSQLKVQWALQDELPPPREKPWGTTHALLSAAPMLERRSFAVVNADDYYGVGGIEAASAWLRMNRRRHAGCIVAYRLGDTLSDKGTVSRGICEVNGIGQLVRCVEHLKIARGDDGVIRSEHGELTHSAAASMNLFAFDASVVDLLRQAWATWFGSHQGDPEDECRLPEMVNDLVAMKRLGIDVKHTDATWMGITYTEDVAAVRDALAYRFS